jgi:hypothetical protein
MAIGLAISSRVRTTGLARICSSHRMVRQMHGTAPTSARRTLVGSGPPRFVSSTHEEDAQLHPQARHMKWMHARCAFVRQIHRPATSTAGTGTHVWQPHLGFAAGSWAGAPRPAVGINTFDGASTGFRSGGRRALASTRSQSAPIRAGTQNRRDGSATRSVPHARPASRRVAGRGQGRVSTPGQGLPPGHGRREGDPALPRHPGRLRRDREPGAGLGHRPGARPCIRTRSTGTMAGRSRAGEGYTGSHREWPRHATHRPQPWRGARRAD